MRFAENLNVTQSSIAPGVIDLGVGHPGPDLLPQELMARAAAHRFAEGDRDFLQYGLEAGSPYLRMLLARFLSDGYGFPLSAESLCMTNGISQALDLICTLYTQPGDTVLVEDPTYFLALRIFADHGLRVVGLATDRDGLLPDSLAEALAAERARFLYVIPTHQNPSGATLSSERRSQVMQLCAEHGCLVVADEVYHLLSWGAVAPTALGAWADEGSVISLGSFSKILAPGLRLGWIHAGADHVRRVTNCGLLDSGGGLNPFTGAMVQSVLELDLLGPHVEMLRATYRARLATLAAALRRECGALAEFDEPDGGYFLWLKLAEGLDPSGLAEAAGAARVGYRAGKLFSTGGAFADCLRLCLAFYAEPQLEEAAVRLSAAMRAVAR